jgi:F-type H+-transporting ATPase subunit epsilon
VADFALEVVTPERTLVEGQAEMVSLRSAEGDIAFLAGHVPYIGAVRTCLVQVHRSDGTLDAVAVHGGFVEVVEGRLVLLAGVGEAPDQIDVDRARHALATAEAEGDEPAIARAQVRLELAGASP